MRSIIVFLIALSFFTANARADVEVIRVSEENPAVTIAKSTFWGGVTGLLLGGAVALVANDNEGNIVKWAFVTGVFAGFGVGVYHVWTRPRATSSLLETDGDGLTFAVPAVEFDRTGGERSAIEARVAVFSYNF